MNTTRLSRNRASEMGVVSRNWRIPLLALGIGVTVLFAFYWRTFYAMVEIWERSETFAHGFLIFPISAYLIWRRRRELGGLTPRPDWRGLPVLAVLGFGWLLANVVDVRVVQQFAFIAMWIALTWSILGWKIIREIVFPLGFLFFAVPFGEFLIPPLMDFTADFTVMMIELTGIPVYREGTFFSIPSGDWSVVEGCSGLRYLIASITVGCLYAYLSYRSLWRRLAFVGLAIFFPVIANGLRAYMIVMIAHFSDMQLALGVDHYIYGWVFFGLVMLLMFWIGSFWQEDEPERGKSSGQADKGGHAGSPLQSIDGDAEPQTRMQMTNVGRDPQIRPHPKNVGADPCVRPPSGEVNLKSHVLIACIGLFLLTVWPVHAAYLRDLALSKTAPVGVSLPEGESVWRRVEGNLTSWEPRYLYPDAKAKAVYTDGERQVELYVLYYRTQAQGKELVNSQNILIPQKHPVWKMPWEKTREVVLSHRTLRLREGILESARQKLLVWRWNWVSGRFTANDHWAKLLEARDKLLGHPRDAAGIVMAAEYGDTPERAAQILRDFSGEMLPAIRRSLQRTARNR
ncbi:exosortase A [Methylohalobius crimeensis]|uniref:exosortase A n=1 Tax=Methylohalobius crimeensis TaxID=244365 RepID=UPI0003B58759|nr:exosortase A [Methylohalobius crimeensis]